MNHFVSPKGIVSKAYIRRVILTVKTLEYKNITKWAWWVISKQYMKPIQQIQQLSGYLVSYIYEH